MKISRKLPLPSVSVVNPQLTVHHSMKVTKTVAIRRNRFTVRKSFVLKTKPV